MGNFLLFWVMVSPRLNLLFVPFYFCSCLLLLLLKSVFIVALSFLLMLFIFNLSCFVPKIFLWYSVGYCFFCPLSCNFKAGYLMLNHRLSPSTQVVGWVKDKKELSWCYEQSLEEYMSSSLFSESDHSIYLEKEIEGHKTAHRRGSRVDLGFVEHKIYTIWGTVFKEMNTKLWYKLIMNMNFYLDWKKKTKLCRY